MTKKQRAKAAIVGLLEDLQSTVDLSPLHESDFDETKVAETNPPEGILGQPQAQTSSTGIRYHLRTLDPNQCHTWKLANRITAYINEESCAELIESIKTVGQQIPVIVRSTSSDSFEVICGARRHFVCRLLGIPLLAAIVDFDDQEALLAMDAENRPRTDISAYERACDYKRWVDSGIYLNFSMLQKAIGINKSLFSKLMSLADLPEEMVYTFQHPSQLSLARGYELAKLYRDNPDKRNKLLEIARSLSGQSLSADFIYRKFKQVNDKDKETKQESESWVLDKSNNPVFMVKHGKRNTSIVFKTKPSSEVLGKITTFSKKLLDKD